jgi:nucleotide-binding universal stress UspA family protein
LDGSALAEQALSCARMLGQGLSAELVLFRAVSIPSDLQDILDQTGQKADALATRNESEANGYLTEVAGPLREAGLSVRHVVQHGSAAEAIVDYAAGTEIRVIVMATHGLNCAGTSWCRWMVRNWPSRYCRSSARLPVFLRLR